MAIRWHCANRSVNRAAPSSMEYSVCTCRCTNELRLPDTATTSSAGLRAGSGRRGRSPTRQSYTGAPTESAWPAKLAARAACRGSTGPRGGMPALAAPAYREHEHPQVDQDVVEDRQQQAAGAEVEHGQAAAQDRGAEHAGDAL